MSTTLLIDADEYLFKATSVVEREIRWDEDNHILYCNRKEAWGNFRRMLDELLEKLRADDLILCFSGKRPYFREDLERTYKGGRNGRKPLCYSDLKELCGEQYVCKAFKGLEADDVMGILATTPHEGQRIIVSQDKDMQQIPGFLFREGLILEIDEETADRYFLFQALRGDPTDGYPGCPGMGDVKATKWLAALYTWPRVVLAYEKAGLTADDALLQARLARILRKSDWDSTNKKVKLWEPVNESV